MAEPSLLSGVLAGAAWNVVNLFCFSQLLATWIGPRHSRRRAMGWLAAKLCLYAIIGVLFVVRAVSFVGFGIGFGVTLAAGIAWVALRSRRTLIPHGR